jgi:sugar phosphate isomerase/epimerase
MKISTSLNIIYGRNDVPCDPEWMAKIAEAGFDGLDFNFLDIEDDVDWFNDETAERYVDNLATVAANNKLIWFQAHAPIYNFLLKGDAVERKHALCLPAIKACSHLNIPWLVFHPCECINYNASTQRKEVFQKNKEHFQILLDECEKYNVGIAVENMAKIETGNSHSCFAATAEELCELVDVLNHPLAGICWDTGHAKISGLDQNKQIAMLGARLKVLHIQDNDGLYDDHLLPYTRGPNGVDWHNVIQGLNAASYSGALNIEAHNSFRMVPDELLFDTIKYSAAILKYIKKQIILMNSNSIMS